MRFLALFALMTAVVAADLAPAFAAARVGDLLTWDVRGAPAEWLVCDVERCPLIEFTAPDAGIVRRRAFLTQAHETDETVAAGPEFSAIGERGLQVRHVARSPGVHRWRLLAPDAATTLAVGEIDVGASDSPPGPIRISPHNPRLLAFADGTPFIPIGPNIAWTLPPDRPGRFDRFFTALAAAGGNHARVWCASWCGQIESDRPDDYRLDHAWLLDQVFATARRHGIRITLVLDNHHDFVYGKSCPYGGDFAARVSTFLAKSPGPQYARRLKYLFARYGADDQVMAWELFNELDMACAVRQIGGDWARGAAKLVAQLDQDQRLRTISWAGSDIGVVGRQPGIDLVQLRGYVLEFIAAPALFRSDTTDSIGLLGVGAQAAQAIGRPFCFSEVGYQGAETNNPGNDGDPDGLLMRQQMWAGFMLGGYGAGMNWWWDVYIDHQGLWDAHRGLSECVRLIDWREAGLAPLTPNQGHDLRVLGWLGPTQALIWPHHRRDTWHAHLVGKKPRVAFDRAMSFGLTGMRPDFAVIIETRDLVSGQVQATAEARTDATGKVRLTLPSGAVDTVLVVTPAK